MKRFIRQTKLVFIFLAATFIIAACGTQSGTTNPPRNTTPPTETINLNINLSVYNSSDASVEKTAVIINDANGNVLDYKILDNPSAKEHLMTFNNVPTNGTVTVLSKSTRHLTWPTDDNYSTILFKTYDTAMVQKAEGKIGVSPSWAYLRWSNSAINTQSLKLQAPCPEGANYLGSIWFIPSSRSYSPSRLECSNGAVDGSLWNPVRQSDGNISAIVWSQIEESPYNQDGYTQPLQYLRAIDHDPDDTYSVADNSAYSGDTTTASLTIANLPSDAQVHYNLTGIRKEAPLTGLQAYSNWGSPTSTATLANVASDLDSLIQHVQIYKEFSNSTDAYIKANYRLYKFAPISSFQANTTWDFSNFPTAPNPGGVSLQQNDRLLLRAQDYGSGNKYAIFRVWTITLQPDPLYIRWFGYAKVNPTSSSIQYSYPKLPTELQQFAPNISYDYVSANISARSYDLYPNQFITEGTARFVYVRKRDNITSQTVTSTFSPLQTNNLYAEDAVEPEFLFEGAPLPY